jgi:hypothetical protein
MQGRVIVAAGEAPEVTVSIEDTDMLNMRPTRPRCGSAPAAWRWTAA